MITRLITKDVVDVLKQFPALALVGPRQVGKTTLVKGLGNKLKKELVYLDLENPRDEAKLSDPMLFFENNLSRCIVLDEIQRRPDLFPLLRSAIDLKRTPARFILLGSASPELIKNASETLAGRIYYQELSPFHFLEVYKKFTYEKHLLLGGFPESILAKSIKQSLRWRESFLKTYVERDLPLLGLSLLPSESGRLIRMISHLHGQILNNSELSKSMGVTSPSIKKYLHFLEHAFLIRLLEPYHVNRGKRLVKSPKIYIRDSGIVTQLEGIEKYNDLISHPKVGSIWEGYVIEQIRNLLPQKFDVCFYRTQHGAEIDLVILKGEKVVMGIEIKFTSAPSISRGNIEAMEDLKLSNLYVVIPGQEHFKLKHDAEVVSLTGILKLVEKLGK